MPKSPACTGAPAYQLLAGGFSYPALAETNGLSVAIPTSEPETAQISYTVATGHLPTQIGNKFAYSISPLLWVNTSNTSGALRTISYRTLLNGVSVQTGSLVVATSGHYGYFSFYYWGATLPAVGDTITVKLWANGSGTTLLNHAFGVCATRIAAGLSGFVVFNDGSSTFAVFEGSYPKPSWAAGGAGLSNRMEMYITPATSILTTTLASNPAVIYAHAVSGIGRNYYEGGTNSAGQTAAASVGNVTSVRRITSLRMLKLNIKI